MQENQKERRVKMRAGLEIHQQLDTGKLFCRCPSILRNEKGNWIVKRKLHAVAGESGEVDIAAKHESLKDLEFIYEGFKDTCCLIEFDEEPPKEIDREALKITIQIALLLNCKLFSTTQIMRKTVLDGSNTSGFQRTVLIARDGFLETSFGKVGIQTICLEEDAARIIEKKENQIIYRLDRLGIPLVEITTAPELYYPEQVREAALRIGEILRACKVKRGIGTIRQDLNISTPGHPRIEIKGFQDPKMMIPTIEKEIERQKNKVREVKKKIEGEVRKANDDGTTIFLRPISGADRMYPETDLPLLKISRELINETKKSLPKLKTEIKGELKKKGLNEEMVSQILRSNKLEEFEILLKIYNNPHFVAKLLLIIPKDIVTKEKVKKGVFTLDILKTILQAISNKKINEEDARQVLEAVAKGKNIHEALKIEKIDLNEIEGEIVKIVKEKPGLNTNAYMGLIMAKFKGKISGKDVMAVLTKLLK